MNQWSAQVRASKAAPVMSAILNLVLFFNFAAGAESKYGSGSQRRKLGGPPRTNVNVKKIAGHQTSFEIFKQISGLKLSYN
jgi:hypothetical protein